MVNADLLLCVTLCSVNKIFDRAPWTGDRPITAHVLAQTEMNPHAHAHAPSGIQPGFSGGRREYAPETAR